jgi:hypothetical protein
MTDKFLSTRHKVCHPHHRDVKIETRFLRQNLPRLSPSDGGQGFEDKILCMSIGVMKD